MKVVAENSAEDLARNDAEWAFSDALVELTANLLRITRGAGKGYEVIGQIRRLDETAIAYRAAFGHAPPSHLFNSVLKTGDDLISLNDRDFRFARIKEVTVAGALQFTASKLIGQHTQATRGEREMYDGMLQYVDYINEQRRETAEAQKRARPTPVIVHKDDGSRKKAAPKTRS